MEASRTLYTVGAVMGLFTAGAHELVGNPDTIGKLGSSNLDDLTVWTFHWTWHLDIVGPLAMAALLLVGARVVPGKWLTTSALALSIAYSLVSLGVALFGDSVFWQSPAPYVWTTIALINGTAVARDQRGYDMIPATEANPRVIESTVK